ncbi:hypothetical protein THRCLA_01392 [Thraustotheca clavata]|uniref:Transmembrane protein n=1 Tax=Thraustotheca clavata TaxID=74557 RepID=A0A1W0A987_9STRA|nr:hypothetical protein THRCLA_01392 [Thraustotheca clavata]
MVAACSNVANGFKEYLSLHGWLQFIVICFTYSAAWHAYTHFNARFSETSLLHYVFLYILLIGLGSMVLASEPGPTFTIGLILIRVALLCMNASVYMSLPQGRVKARTDLVFDFIVTVFSVVALSVDSFTFTIVVYAATSVCQILFALFVAKFSWFASSCIPINFDHVADREGSLVMVALGESVVSAVINSRQHEHELPTKFYAAMQLSVLIIFALAIFYFATRPPRDMHAMRRSVNTGAAFTALHFILLPTLLAVGVGIKLVSEAVLHHESLSKTA